MSKKLHKYVKDMKMRGYSEEAITRVLKQYNYPDEMIDTAFKSLEKKFDAVFAMLVVLIVILVILVVFGISRGVSTLSVFQPDPVCEQTEFRIFKNEGKDMICSDETKVQMMIENYGNTTITRMKMTVKGSSGKTSFFVDDLNLAGNDIFPYIYKYEGQVEEMKITPYADGKRCANRMIEISEIDKC